MQALNRWRFALTRKRLAWLFVVFNFTLLAAMLISIYAVGIDRTWGDVTRWLAIPAAISFPSSIQPILGLFIWVGLHNAIYHQGFKSWDALGAAAVVTTGVLTLPISYLTGVAIYNLSRKYKWYGVIAVYMLFSATVLFSAYEITVLSG